MDQKPKAKGLIPVLKSKYIADYYKVVELKDGSYNTLKKVIRA